LLELFELAFKFGEFILQADQDSRAQVAESPQNEEVVVGNHELTELAIANILPRLLLTVFGSKVFEFRHVWARRLPDVQVLL